MSSNDDHSKNNPRKERENQKGDKKRKRKPMHGVELPSVRTRYLYKSHLCTYGVYMM